MQPLSRQVALALTLFLVLPPPSFAQNSAAERSAEALLQAVDASYGDLTEFRLDGAETTVTRSGELERRTESRTVTAAGDAGRFRVESDHPVDGGIIAFDGETTWIYVARRNQYRRIQGALLEGGSESPKMVRLKNRFVGRYQGVTERLQSARLLPAESLEIDGHTIQCHVVEATYDAPRGLVADRIVRTYWIGVERPLVYRESSEFEAKNPVNDHTTAVSQQIVFRSIQVGDEVSEDAFVPRLPEDAVQVSDFPSVEGPSAWAGRQAVKFEERDLSGNVHRSSDLDGKVVLLDFWATWCGPCRIELPLVDSLYREFSDRGLAVFGVNDESPDLAGAFVEDHGLSFPTLSDTAGLLLDGYEVRNIPTTIIIGRDGRVSAYLMGAHSAEELRQAIREAGIE